MCALLKISRYATNSSDWFDSCCRPACGDDDDDVDDGGGDEDDHLLFVLVVVAVDDDLGLVNIFRII